jgi:uncharacterized membrane protein
LRKEHRLRVFENRVLRKMLGSQREELTGDWRKLHNEELRKFVFTTKYYSAERIKQNKMGGACST